MVTSRNAVAFVNIHPQKSKWVTAKIILVSPASILVGEWLQRQRHIGAWPLYILFKCDVRHRLHCFVCTDTHLFNFTKGKTDLVNQRWRRTTCLQHQCYDVGCYPWICVFIFNHWCRNGFFLLAWYVKLEKVHYIYRWIDGCNFQIKIAFISVKIGFISENSEDPDKI